MEFTILLIQKLINSKRIDHTILQTEKTGINQIKYNWSISNQI